MSKAVLNICVKSLWNLAFISPDKQLRVELLGHRLPWWLRWLKKEKKSACNAGDMGSIPGSGVSPGEENDNLLQYSCPENSRDSGAWRATVHGVAKNKTRLSN